MSQPQSRNYSSEDWEKMKDTIHDIYIVQDVEFKKMQAKLFQDYGFCPSKNKFLNMLKAWGFRKYSTGDSWRSLNDHVKRKGVSLSDGIQNIEINGQTVSVKKLKREMARYGRQASESVVDASSVATMTGSQSSTTIASVANPETDARPSDLIDASSVATLPATPLPAIPPLELEEYAAFEPFEQPSADASKLLKLPMFELLRVAAPTSLPSQLTRNLPSPQAQDRELTYYTWIRAYILQAVSVTGEAGNDDFECRTLVMKASAGLLTQLSVVDTVRKHLGQDDISSCVEAVLPSLQYSSNFGSVHQDLEGSLFARHEAVVFYFCYLIVNNLIQAAVLDDFFRWASRIWVFEKILRDITKLSSPIARSLKDHFLHCAIRAQQPRQAVQLLDLKRAQLVRALVTDKYGEDKMQFVLPLQTAVLCGDPEIVQSLIDAGCSVNPLSSIEKHIWHKCPNIADPPLCLAVRNSELGAVVDVLLSKDSDCTQVALQTAILSGFGWSYVKKLLSAGACVSPYATKGHPDQEISAVHAASIRGDNEILENLLDLNHTANGMTPKPPPYENNGVVDDIYWRFTPGPSPLMLAISSNHIKAALLLISRGAEVNAGSHGDNALSLAIQKRSSKLVVAILEQGITDWTDPSNSRLPFTCAIQAKDPAMLKLLFTYIDYRYMGNTIWNELRREAAKLGDINIMHVLLLKRHITLLPSLYLPCHEDLEEPLLAAASSGRVKMMQFLIGMSDTNPRAYRSDDNRLLQAAAESRCYAAFTFVVEELGMSTNKHSTGKFDVQWQRTTLLSAAAASNQLAIVTMLLQDGASPEGDDVVNAWVARPITNAIKHGNWNMLRKLLTFGAKIDVGDPCSGFSKFGSLWPAEYALARNQSIALEIMRSFLPHGCAFRMAAGEEFWAQMLEKLDRPVATGSLNILLDLAEWKSNPAFQLSLTWIFKQEFHSERSADLLIAHGALIECEGHNNVTPLQSALMNRRFDYARKLVNMGANVAARQAYHSTEDGPGIFADAIQAACVQGHVSSVEMLLENGALPEDREFRRVLSYPLRLAAEKGYISIIEILLGDSAPAYKGPNCSRWSAIESAAVNGRVDAMMLLLNNINDAATCQAICSTAKRSASEAGQFLAFELLEEYEKEHGFDSG